MRKGISQVLVVIVTAIVLMTTALSVILLVQSGSESSLRGLERSACTNAVSTQCSGTDSITTPSSCFNDNGEIPDQFSTNIESLDSVDSVDGTSISCASTGGPFSGG